MLKFISWNVNGLRACVGKGFEEVFKTLDADFFCLQETKMQPHQLDLRFPGYTSYWNSAEKKGYSGTAIYTREAPVAVTYGMGIEEHDKEGRIITLEMPDFYLVCVYVPNSQDELRRLDYRMQWEDASGLCHRLGREEGVVICGISMWPTKKSISRTPPLIAATQDLPTGRVSSRSIRRRFHRHQAAGIPTKSNIPGGPTVSAHGRTTPAGASIIFWCPKISRTGLQAPTSTTTFSVRTIVPWNLHSDEPMHERSG